MDKLSDFLNRYPRQIWDILGAIAFLSVPAWFLSEPISEILDPTVFLDNSTWYKLSISVFITALLYLIFDLIIYVKMRGAAVRLEKDSGNSLRNALKHKDCLEINVFSSGGDDGKNRLLSLVTENFQPRKEIRIKVLLRGDNTTERDGALKSLVYRWKIDIDEFTASRDCGYKFTTEFSIHNHPVMLRGFIFGNRSALLSWYAREDSSIRSSPNMPYFFVDRSNPQGRKFINEAKMTFDHFFASGKKI